MSAKGGRDPDGDARSGVRAEVDAASARRAARLDERELIARARNGEESAFRDLYDANVERVFRVAFRMTGREDEARDCTQEAFIRAFRRLEQFRGDAAFSTWLHRVAVSVTLNHLRKRKRRRGREVDLEGARGLSAPPRHGEPELRERLHRAIDGLGDIYRTVFLMHDLEGFTHEEIAAALDVAVGTSKARLSRARAMLRDVLGDAVKEYA